MKRFDQKQLKKLLYNDAVALSILLVVALGALGLRFVNSRLPEGIDVPYCLCHDILRLYCPFCGCTRAGVALLRLDLVESFKANPLVLLALLGFVAYNAASLVRIWRKREPLKVKNAGIWAGVLLLAFALVRNALMIFFKFDTLGELVSFWQFV